MSKIEPTMGASHLQHYQRSLLASKLTCKQSQKVADTCKFFLKWDFFLGKDKDTSPTDQGKWMVMINYIVVSSIDKKLRKRSASKPGEFYMDKDHNEAYTANRPP